MHKSKTSFSSFLQYACETYSKYARYSGQIRLYLGQRRNIVILPLLSWINPKSRGPWIHKWSPHSPKMFPFPREKGIIPSPMQSHLLVSPHAIPFIGLSFCCRQQPGIDRCEWSGTRRHRVSGFTSSTGTRESRCHLGWGSQKQPPRGISERWAHQRVFIIQHVSKKWADSFPQASYLAWVYLKD